MIKEIFPAVPMAFGFAGKGAQQVEVLLASEAHRGLRQDLQKFARPDLLPRAQRQFPATRTLWTIRLYILELLDPSWIFVRGGAIHDLAIDAGERPGGGS